MFTVIRDIMTKKDGKSLVRSDFNEVYNGYMVQRWITMYSDLNVELLNASVNILYKTLNDEQQFKLMIKILPRCPMKGKYIKVGKKASNKKEKEVVDISQSFEESSSKIEESLALVLGEKYNER